jgi:phosphate transport system substrate-binding protein
VISTVADTSGAIGYVDLGSANAANASITAINIAGNAPTTGLVTSNSYQFWAIERMYTNKNPDAVSHSFINFVISDIKTNGTFIRLGDMRPGVLLSHE